jgi:hypothetical protein
MTRKEKCELAIEKGFTYNPETGKVYGIYGKEITSEGNGYIKINLTLNNKNYYLKGHIFAWYFINKTVVKQIDHINGIRLDNRICNLRSVTHQQNQWNKTKAKGYCWNKKANKFQASIRINNKQIYLGLFEKEEDANAIYLEAKKQYHII